MASVISGESIIDLSEEQKFVRDELFRYGQFDHRYATVYVSRLNDREVEVVKLALADGRYFVTALEQHRAAIKAQIDKIAKDFVDHQPGLQATAEAIVLTERRSASGA